MRFALPPFSPPTPSSFYDSLPNVSAASRPASALLAPAPRRFMGGGGHDEHHGPVTLEPPFQRLPLPSGPLPEEHELIWHDGVAPEQALDFDVPHISTRQALLMWLGGFGFFFGLYQLVKTLDHPSNKESVRCRPFYEGRSAPLTLTLLTSRSPPTRIRAPLSRTSANWSWKTFRARWVAA